ncbi:MAG: hypothetical protein AAB316_02930, partial [Bacteroidota bacterium]
FVLPNAFVKANNGQPVTGEIDLGLYEVKTKGDMIRFNLPTMTTDLRVLESGGMVYFAAEQNGQPLRLKPGYSFEINQWTENPVQDMRLFFETFPPSLSDTFNAWALFPDSIENNVILTSSPDTINLPGFGFFYAIDTMYTWINCDRFLDVPASQLTNASAKLSDVFTTENTAVYLVFNELNSVIRLWTLSDPSLFHGENFPLDAKVTFLAVAVSQDGAYFFDKKTTTLSVGKQVELLPKETSLEKILDSLEDLP